MNPFGWLGKVVGGALPFVPGMTLPFPRWEDVKILSYNNNYTSSLKNNVSFTTTEPLSAVPRTLLDADPETRRLRERNIEMEFLVSAACEARRVGDAKKVKATAVMITEAQNRWDLEDTERDIARTSYESWIMAGDRSTFQEWRLR